MRDDETTSELLNQMLWQRFSLSSALKPSTGPEKTILVRTASRLGDQIAKMEAERPGSWQSSHNTILAREIMADNIEAANDLATASPEHPMVNIFLRDAAQNADHACAMRSKTRDIGPFGGLLQLAWMLRRTEQPTVVAAAPLALVVHAAREIPKNQVLSDWSHPAVEKFIIANAEAGLACGL